jgi:hypothetical protein
MSQDNIDKLLNILKRKTDKNVKLHDNEIMSFIQFYNIKSGRVWVRSTVLYKLYKAWSETPIDFKKFTLFMARYLPYKSNKGFRISTSSLDISKKTLEILIPKKTPLLKIKSIHLFIEEHQIQSGPFWHVDTLVYKIFRKWSRKKHMISVTSDVFKSIMKTLVAYKITEEQHMYFGLNQDLRKKDNTQRGEKKEYNKTIKT